MQEFFGMRTVRAKRYVATRTFPHIRRYKDSQVQGRAFADACTNAHRDYMRIGKRTKVKQRHARWTAPDIRTEQNATSGVRLSSHQF